MSKLIREGGILAAPDQLSGRVMDLVTSEPEKIVLKPLVGRGGKIVIILLVTAVIALSFVFTEPGSRGETASWISNLGLTIPEVHLNYKVFQDINISTGIVSAVVALFILVLFDAGFRRKRFIL